MARVFSSSRRGLLSIVVAAILWGTTGAITREIYDLDSTNVLSIAFLRLAIAAFVLILLCLRTLGLRVWRIKSRDLVLMLCMGAMQAVSQYCYLAAIPECGITIATLIAICVAPVVVVLFATLVFHERMTRKIVFALICALIGTALLTGTSNGENNFRSLLVGVVLALISAITYASVILLGRTLSSRYHPLQVNTTSFASGALILLVCSLPNHLVLSYSVESWLLLLYIGCIPTALAYVLFQVGMRSTPATLTSILTFCEPLTAAILAWIFFDEQLSPSGILGALLLMGTIGLLAFVESTPEVLPTSK